jgi:hypothetical protein
MDKLDLGCLFVVIVVSIIIFFIGRSCYRTIGLDEHFDSNITAALPQCLNAIENRDWDDYRASIEPSAVVSHLSPATVVHFMNVETRVIKNHGSSATVELTFNLRLEGDTTQYPIRRVISLVKVNQPNWLGSLGLKKWYIAAEEVDILPFNYLNEKF